MFGRTSRFVMVLLVALTCVMSLVGAPNIARGSEGGFTAAATVLKQSGTPGHYMFPDFPGFPPVKCTDYPYGYNPGGSPERFISAHAPNIYSVPGLDGQPIDVTYRLSQRWPDGSLHPKAVTKFYSTASQNAPSPVGSAGFHTYDRASTFVLTVEIVWYFGSTEVGRVELLYTQYQSNVYGSPSLPVTNACKPLYAATAVLGTSEGTVGANIPFTLNYFPSDPEVGIYFDGKKIGTVATDAWGGVKSSFIVPAAPMGKHTVKFYRFGHSASAAFTIKPRIKVIPSSNIMRDQTVNVSLRGYAKYETVNIRWKKGTSWVQIATVKTSSTGSANINVKVPKWVPNGSTSVRGDGSFGHAQTNAVTVSGGPLSSSTVKPTPSSTPAATSTPIPTSTSAPVSTPEPTSTAVPTQEPTAPEPVASETATAESTEESIAEPTEEVSSPTETPPVEPTSIPSEAPEATATEGTS